MELKVSVSEAIALIKEVENVPAKILEFIGMNIQKEVGAFLSNLMGQELAHHVGRERLPEWFLYPRLLYKGYRGRYGQRAQRPQWRFSITGSSPFSTLRFPDYLRCCRHVSDGYLYQNPFSSQ